MADGPTHPTSLYGAHLFPSHRGMPMPVNPNSSSSSSSSDARSALLQAIQASSGWYYRLWMIYAMPLVIVFGLANNAISLLVFRSSRLQLAPRLKRYYEAIAVCPFGASFPATVLQVFDRIQVVAWIVRWWASIVLISTSVVYFMY